MLKEVEKTLGDYSTILKPKSKVEIIETDLDDIILIDGSPMIMMIDGEPFPTLKGALGTGYPVQICCGGYGCS